MKNILRRNQEPGLSVAMRAKMIADLDAESREHERLEYEFAKKALGYQATTENVRLGSQEDTAEK